MKWVERGGEKESGKLKGKKSQLGGGGEREIMNESENELFYASQNTLRHIRNLNTK